MNQIERASAFWHLRCLWVHLHDRLPNAADVRRMFDYLRPDLSDELTKQYEKKYGLTP